MAAKRSIQVLKAYRPFFRILTIYNAEKFQILNWKECVPVVCKAVILPVLLIWCHLSAFWYCVDQKFNLHVIAQPLSLLLGAIQMTCIYVALSMMNRKTEQTIDLLQEIIGKRE